MSEKDGAFLTDSKIAAGVDSSLNQHPLNCTTDGTLEVDATISGQTGPIDVIVDNVVPVSQSGTWSVLNGSQLIPFAFDYVGLSPTGTNPTTIVYKTGGASGTTVATLTLTYDANNNVQTVTRS